MGKHGVVMRMLHCLTAQAGSAVKNQRKRRKKRGIAVKPGVVMRMLHCLTAQAGSVVKNQRKRRKKREIAVKPGVVMRMLHCLTAQEGSAVQRQRVMIMRIHYLTAQGRGAALLVRLVKLVKRIPILLTVRNAK